MDASPNERDPRSLIVDIAAFVGLAGIAAGAVILGPTDLGFDGPAAVDALLAWIPVTLPIAIAVLAASIADLGAGIVLARAVRGRPFERLDEALLQGFVAAVVKDALLLGLLAGFGLFSQPVLIGVHAAILAAGAFRLRPLLGPGAIPPRPGGVSPLGALIAVAWAAPVVLQLASPVVPFIDILPNHVAPAEHLRVFGTLTHLTDTQSPIYGPSRIFLGYTALLGTITTGTGLPAGAALAGFILPSTVLVAVAVQRLATALGGRGVAPWALLAFAMTTSLARLGDARATVIVLPLVAWSLAVLAERLGAESTRTTWSERRLGMPFADGVLVGLGLGAAILVHPVIGFLACLTVAIVVLAAPDRVSRLAVPALGTAAVVGASQAATMLGIALPPIALAAAVGLGILVGIGLDRSPAAVREALVTIGRLGAAAGAILAIVSAGPVVRAAVAGAQPLVSVVEVAFIASVVAVALRAPAGRSLVLWAALAAGFGVAALTQLVPGEGSGLLGQALRFELPKTLQYWVPVFTALLAAGGLAALVTTGRLSLTVRAVAIAAFLGTAALPLRTSPIDAFHLGEHRLSETLSIALRWAGTGFWTGFPDSRYVVDAPRREILDAVRGEIAAGRIGPDTPVLHVADSFQQWRSTPLGVFAGVTETDVTPDAVESIHTVGGRLHPMGDLAGLLTGGRYAYVLFEPNPDELPPGIRDQIVAAGYASVFTNAQGELFRLGGS
ncbi:MAG TPA: hypothetical protein VFV53_04705 [Candidatus Limnocylindrales bacterium]|nr:hypothetical protein [Candidatus Limnocylindrales bacterium]